ncbi:cyclic pyranopterin monophosphate synthase [Arthrobacter sp. Hiyo8]|nr:cyclic pyranopterin monophosphate synthase [Arthrobacter sp. Hiyo8]
MRLSLTDKCNLRCTYCMPAEGLEWLSKQAVMTAAEIVRLVRIGVEHLGVRELRLTGGEPLVRADLVDIITALRQAHPDLPISMTTNGVGLDKKAAALKQAGLTRINVSLDSLHEETFTKLTRRPFLDKVLAGVDAARAAGLGRSRSTPSSCAASTTPSPPSSWPGHWSAAMNCASSNKCRWTPTTAGPGAT